MNIVNESYFDIDPSEFEREVFRITDNYGLGALDDNSAVGASFGVSRSGVNVGGNIGFGYFAVAAIAGYLVYTRVFKQKGIQDFLKSKARKYGND